jgi:hypothetical protein
VGFDGDATLAFEIHGVEDLFGHLATGERSGDFEQAVGKRAFAVIDMGDDREVSNVLEIYHWF